MENMIMSNTENCCLADVNKYLGVSQNASDIEEIVNTYRVSIEL